MRKVLNILEVFFPYFYLIKSCSMSNPSKNISISAVYQATGKPSPEVLDQIYKSLLEKTFEENTKSIFIRNEIKSDNFVDA